MKTVAPKSSLVGYGLIIFSSALYGSFGIWARYMGETFAPFYQGWVRSLIVMLLMLPILLATKSFRKIDREDWPALAVFLGFSVFVIVPLYYAYNHAPIGTVQLIFYSMFVVAAYLMGGLYLKEKITKIKIISMMLAFAGLLLVFGVSALTFAPLGLALALFNGVASGGENASTKKLTDKYKPGFIVFLGWGVILLTHLPMSLLLGEKQVMPAFNAAWGALLIYSVVNAAAYWIGIEGFRHVDVSIASLVGLTEILFAVAFSTLIFHDVITWSVIIGGVVIITAAMLPDLTNLIRHRRTRVPIEPFPEI